MAEDARYYEPYLNSKTRVASRLIFAALEYVFVFLIVTFVVDYLHNGTISFDTVMHTVAEYLKPGGVIFTALLAYLPILLIKNVGFYFGLGSVPRMIFGIAGYLLVIWWLFMFASSAGDFDIMKMVNISSQSIMGVESVTVNLTGIAKILSIVFVICCIIPLGEFIGARKRHKEALEWKESH